MKFKAWTERETPQKNTKFRQKILKKLKVGKIDFIL